jgi:uncharacterized membrane protein
MTTSMLGLDDAYGCLVASYAPIYSYGVSTVEPL